MGLGRPAPALKGATTGAVTSYGVLQTLMTRWKEFGTYPKCRMSPVTSSIQLSGSGLTAIHPAMHVCALTWFKTEPNRTSRILKFGREPCGAKIGRAHV